MVQGARFCYSRLQGFSLGVGSRQNRTIVFRQAVYARKILQLYGAWDGPTVKTPLEAGVRLSKADSPEVADPVLHRRYSGITGHLSFLVMMTRCNLAFAYAELSKFVQLPWPEHLKAAEWVLHFLQGNCEDWLTYSYPGPYCRNRLLGWVDSDYVSDPDTRKSVTGYVLSLNNAPIS
eukprot:2347864-Rhodomonas_salina.2